MINLERKRQMSHLDRLQRLLGESELAEIAKAYQAKGYSLSAHVPVGQPGWSQVDIVGRNVSISLDELDTIDAPELEAFIALLMHEFGHLEAHLRGLEITDEKLAWKIAEEICPIRLPESWDRIKEKSIASHAWDEKAEEISADRIQEWQGERPRGCLDCLRTPFIIRVQNDTVSFDGIHIDHRMICPSCGNAYTGRFDRFMTLRRAWRLVKGTAHEELVSINASASGD